MHLAGFWLAMGLCLGWAQPILANGLWLKSVASKETNTVSVWAGWKNGWHDSLNHDAIWLFAHGPQGILRPENVRIQQGAERFSVRIANDERGIWLYPNLGNTFADDSALLAIDYGKLPTPSPTLRGIEMVFIPSGPFCVGDSLSNKTLINADRPGSPFQIHSDLALELVAEGALRNPTSSSVNLISEPYPLGFQGFLCMKYEISQGQWVDFFNSLKKEQKVSIYPEYAQRTLPTSLIYKRSGLLLTDGVLSTQTSHRAMGGLNWKDLMAFLDWACLRPLSETEFEKACRGPESPKPKEYAWGTATISLPDSLLFDGTALEGISTLAKPGTGWGNGARPVGQPYVGGPARQGFSATASATREQAGAGYYGNFELSGNVWELCVRLSAGSTFDTSNGDGELSDLGQANQLEWAQIPCIPRGGGHASVILPDFSYPFRDLAVSDRYYINYSGEDRRSTTGGRGARGW